MCIQSCIASQIQKMRYQTIVAAVATTGVVLCGLGYVFVNYMLDDRSVNKFVNEVVEKMQDEQITPNEFRYGAETGLE
jgi:hypothetical protein